MVFDIKFILNSGYTYQFRTSKQVDNISFVGK